MTEDVVVQDAKAVVKKKVKRSGGKKKPKAVSPAGVVASPKPVAVNGMVKVKLNFDTVNPLNPPVLDKATGSFALTYDNIYKRDQIVEVPKAIAEQWVMDFVPMGFKGFGYKEGMEPGEVSYEPRARYV